MIWSKRSSWPSDHGRGSERVRSPRLVLSGNRRAEVIAMVDKAAATRPV